MAILVCLSALSAGAAPASVRTYSVTFTGSGRFLSDETHPIEGTGGCSTATDRVDENDTLKWDVKYRLTLEPGIHADDGTYFDAGPSTWAQHSTITPRDCFGGEQDCRGKLEPASASAPPTRGFKRRPEATFSVESKEILVHAMSVFDWVVADPTGSTGCSSYAHFHTALQPFAFGKRFHQTEATVLTAMSADKFIPLRKLNRKTYTVKIKGARSEQPPHDCARLAVDAITCDETLTWSGELVFRRL